MNIVFLQRLLMQHADFILKSSSRYQCKSKQNKTFDSVWLNWGPANIHRRISSILVLERATAYSGRVFPASGKQMSLPSRCSWLTRVQFGSSLNITSSHCPPELLEQLLSAKQMSLSKLKRSQHTKVKSQSTQSIPLHGISFEGPLAGIYGWAPIPILLWIIAIP